MTDAGARSEWPKVDVIIGNPPFLGVKKMKPELGGTYIERIRRAYPEVPGMADFCVYWIRRTHDELPLCTAADPLRGRAGLVGTQNIRSNESRVGGLDHVTASGTVIEAVDNQPWSGDANVHVSIANWMKSQDDALLPSVRRLWFKTKSALRKPKSAKGTVKAAKEYDLDMREVAFISSALSDKTDTKTAVALACNTKPKRTFQGVTPGHEDFVLKLDAAQALIAKEPAAAKLLSPYVVGKEVLGGATKPSRMILDFGERDLLAAQEFSKALALVKQNVLPKRQEAAEKGEGDDTERSHHVQFLETWWQLSYRRGDLLKAIAGLPRYLACSRVTSRPILFFVDSGVKPGDALQVFAFDDDYSFGVLQSKVHMEWFMSKRSNMKSDPRYSSNNVFGTFPWPQDPTAAQVNAVVEASRKLQAVRSTALATAKGGLRALYDTLTLPGKNPLREAHTALDKAVLAAYGFGANKDVVAQVLALNAAVAGRNKAGQQVTGPGVPPIIDNKAMVVSGDCTVRPN